jgi:hypothetical protein
MLWSLVKRKRWPTRATMGGSQCPFSIAAYCEHTGALIIIQQLGNVNIRDMWTTDTLTEDSEYMGLLITDTIARDWTMGVLIELLSTGHTGGALIHQLGTGNTCTCWSLIQRLGTMITWEWWSLKQQLGFVKMQGVRTTGTTPVDRAQRDVPITDKAAGDGERIGTMSTDRKSGHYQPPSSFCLTSLFFVREGCVFIRLACFLLNSAPLSSLTRWATDFHDTWYGGGHLNVSSC